MNLLDANDRAGEYPRSFYAACQPPRAPLPAAAGDLTADVCIVGGGLTGLSAALHLAERGFDVVLLEAQRLGFGASGRNGGQVGIGQRIDQTRLEALVGQVRARALWDLSLDAVALVRDLCTAMRQPFHDGVIEADHRRRFVPESRAYADKLANEYGYDKIRFLDREALRGRVGSDAYFGGLLDMGAGHIDPLAFVLGLADRAAAAGARLFEGARVTGIAHGRKPVVSTDAATVTADHLILACNGYLGGLEPRVADRVMPINNFIVATEPMDPANQERLIAGNHAVADSKFVINYFRFSEDHRLLFGGSESYGYRFPRDIAAAVRKPMLQIFPQLAATRITHAWGGTLAITMNRLPCFVRLAPNALSLSGYSGQGVALATLGGRLAADLVAGTAEGFDLMASVPTPRFPGGAKMRMPLLVLAMLWYSLRDRL